MYTPLLTSRRVRVWNGRYVRYMGEFFQIGPLEHDDTGLMGLVGDFTVFLFLYDVF